MRDYENVRKRLLFYAQNAVDDDVMEDLTDAADAIEELQAELVAIRNQLPHWIGVDDRLPEDGQWVLVWGHGQKIPIMMFRESGAWIDDQFEFHTTITHWMPLPKPPEGVSEDG